MMDEKSIPVKEFNTAKKETASILNERERILNSKSKILSLNQNGALMSVPDRTGSAISSGGVAVDNLGKGSIFFPAGSAKAIKGRPPLQTKLSEESRKQFEDKSILLAEINELKEKLDVLKQENESLVEKNASVSEIENKFKISQKEVSTLNSELEKAKTVSKSLETQMKDKILIVAKLTEKARKLTDDTKKLTSRVQEAEVEIADKQTKLDSLQSILETSKNENKWLLKKISSQEEQHKSYLESVKQKAKDYISNLHLSAQQNTKQLEKTQNKLDQAHDVITQLSQEKEQLRKRHEQLKKELTLQHETETKNKMATISKLQTTNEELTAEKRRLIQQLTKATDALVNLQKDKDELKTRLIVTLDELNATKQQMHHLETVSSNVPDIVDSNEQHSTNESNSSQQRFDSPATSESSEPAVDNSQTVPQHRQLLQQQKQQQQRIAAEFIKKASRDLKQVCRKSRDEVQVDEVHEGPLHDMTDPGGQSHAGYQQKINEQVANNTNMHPEKQYDDLNQQDYGGDDPFEDTRKIKIDIEETVNANHYNVNYTTNNESTYSGKWQQKSEESSQLVQQNYQEGKQTVPAKRYKKNAPPRPKAPNVDQLTQRQEQTRVTRYTDTFAHEQHHTSSEEGEVPSGKNKGGAEEVGVVQENVTFSIDDDADEYEDTAISYIPAIEDIIVQYNTICDKVWSVLVDQMCSAGVKTVSEQERYRFLCKVLLEAENMAAKKYDELRSLAKEMAHSNCHAQQGSQSDSDTQREEHLLEVYNISLQSLLSAMNMEDLKQDVLKNLNRKKTRTVYNLADSCQSFSKYLAQALALAWEMVTCQPKVCFDIKGIGKSFDDQLQEVYNNEIDFDSTVIVAYYLLPMLATASSQVLVKGLVMLDTAE